MAVEHDVYFVDAALHFVLPWAVFSFLLGASLGFILGRKVKRK
jgi:hypothetical protein